MSEAIIVIGGIGGVLLILWAISHYIFKIYRPKKDRPRILDALELSEQLGVSDIQTDITSTAKRFSLLRIGAGDIKSHNLEDYQERIEAQLDILLPYKVDLDRENMRRAGFTGVDLSGLSNL